MKKILALSSLAILLVGMLWFGGFGFRRGFGCGFNRCGCGFNNFCGGFGGCGGGCGNWWF